MKAAVILSIFGALAGAFGLRLKTLQAKQELNNRMTTPAAGGVLSRHYDGREKLTFDVKINVRLKERKNKSGQD